MPIPHLLLNADTHPCTILDDAVASRTPISRDPGMETAIRVLLCRAEQMLICKDPGARSMIMAASELAWSISDSFLSESLAELAAEL